MRTLTRLELNRALLARQLLLERSRVPLPRALARIGGIQAQYAPSMYIGLWSRIEGFRREALTEALERRSVIQATLMRITIHLVSRADYWPLALATREARRKLWLRTRPLPRAEPSSPLRSPAPTAEAMEGAAQTLRTHVDGGTISRKEMEELLGKVQANGVGLWADLVRAPPAGTWERRRADLFALAEQWLGAPGELAVEDATERLVRRYLSGFGPASRQDVARFCGLPAAAVNPAARGVPSADLHHPQPAVLAHLPGRRPARLRPLRRRAARGAAARLARRTRRPPGGGGAAGGRR